MKIQIELSLDSEPAPLAWKRIEQIADFIWQNEAPAGNYLVSLLFCNDEQMQKLNRMYRGSNQVTDVLSFVQEGFDPVSSEDESLLLCDIVIDTNYVFKQKGSNSFEAELETVLVHSFLHLLGYDHIKPKDKEIMEQKEDYYKHKIQGVN